MEVAETKFDEVKKSNNIDELVYFNKIVSLKQRYNLTDSKLKILFNLGLNEDLKNKLQSESEKGLRPGDKELEILQKYIETYLN